MNWSKEWRIKGIEETRYASPEEAEAARRRVKQMTPQRNKARRESKSTRPSPEICVRVHHSRGRKWEQFLEVMGFQDLSEREQLLLMDSFQVGGRDLFAAWKQREYKGWTPIEKVSVFDYGDRKVVLVKLKDGQIIERPFVDERDEKEKTKKRRRKREAFCSSCSVRLPVSSARDQCSTCSPEVTAEAFFAAVSKNVAKEAK